MKTLLYEGKAKIIHEDTSNSLLAEFKDSLTAFNGIKKDTLSGKGELNCTISSILFQLLESCGIQTHYMEQINHNTMKIKKLTMIAVEFVVRNIAAGSLCKRYGIPQGTVLPHPLVELYYKNDDLGDPLMNEDHVLALNLISDRKILNKIKAISLQVNDILGDAFSNMGIQVVDFKLEFGIDPKGAIILGDELSPDNFRFWDSKTNEPLDKDRFRNDMGNVLESYQEILRRMTHHSSELTQHSRTYSTDIFITPRSAVFDPQGAAVENSLEHIGYGNIKNVRVGKYIQVNVTSNNRKDAFDTIDAACQKFIANPVIEDFEINIR